MINGSKQPSNDAFEPGSISARLTKDHHDLEVLTHEAEQALALGAAEPAFTALDRFWMRLAVHIRAEHKGVFPVLGTALPELSADLGRLREDHDFFMASLAVAVRSMQGARPDFTKAGALLEAVRERMAPHNALEEGTIYAFADQLPPELRRQVGEVIARELAFLPERYGF